MSRWSVLSRTFTQVTALALLAASAWWLWLGWDAVWPVGAAGHATTSTWLVDLWRQLGCTATILLIAVEGHRRLDPRAAGIAVTVGFTAGYAADVLPGDPSGLGAVSVLIVLSGMAKASVALRQLTAPAESTAGSRQHPHRTAATTLAGSSLPRVTRARGARSAFGGERDREARIGSDLERR